MIRASVDLHGVAGYIGAVNGIITAVESPGYKGSFTNDIMGKLRRKFMADTIAANLAGVGNISHAFEWPEQTPDGVSTRQPSSIPLFRVVSRGKAGNKVMTFDFLQSTRPVPLPDPDRYGFKPEKLAFMRRHVFRMKALVMETQSNVEVAPRMAKKLFIPNAKSKYGYYMTPNPVTINPGGARATGQFSLWWTNWFEQRAEVIVKEQVELNEQFLKRTGQRVIRMAAGTRVGGVSVGGRFATGTAHQLEYVGAAKRMAELETLTAAKQFYHDEDMIEE